MRTISKLPSQLSTYVSFNLLVVVVSVRLDNVGNVVLTLDVSARVSVGANCNG